MLSVLLVHAAVASPPPLPSSPCTPSPDTGAQAEQRLRDHTYRIIGHCGSVPVLRTASTDSTFRDREVAEGPVILVTETSVDPTAADDGWPAPPGNLYLSVVLPGPRSAARERLSQALDTWRRDAAPQVAWTEAWDGLYGAHRGPDGRFVSGLLLEERPEGVAVGLDLHLGATQAAYEALGASAEHVSFRELVGRDFAVEPALWTVLNLLVPEAPSEGVSPGGAAPPPTR